MVRASPMKPPLSAAVRELEEETGYVPLPGARSDALGWAWPNPAIQNNRVHSFIVGPVRRAKAQNLDPGEMIDVVEVDLEAIPGMILGGEIRHALILNAFFQLLLKDGAAGGALVESLRRYR